LKWFGLALFGLLFAGCSSQVDYQIGVVTNEVKGSLTAPDEAKPLILVRMSIATFAVSGLGQVHQARAKLVYPDKSGFYSVKMDAEVDQVDLYYLGQGHKVAQASFSRTLGVQAYVLDVTLKTEKNPKLGYFSGLKPLLTQYIVEPRFKMPPKDQLALAKWMDEAESKLYPVPQKQP